MRDQLLGKIYKLGAFCRSKRIDAFRRMLGKIPLFFKAGWVSKKFAACGENFYIESPYTIVGHEYIKIGNNFESRGRLRLEAYAAHGGETYTPEITIGDNVALNFDCHIGCINKIVIGNNVLMASKIFITDHFHGDVDATILTTPPGQRKLVSKGPVIIEDNVWIGEGVVIMPNITIGKNSVIGANAVVTKSFPANAVIAGNPARLIRIIE